MQRQRRDGETLLTRLLKATEWQLPKVTGLSNVKPKRYAFNTPFINIYIPSKASI
jgi:hypothetical protein